MKNWCKNILDYFKRYPFTSLSILLSLLISLYTFFILFDDFKPTTYSLLGIIPTIIFILGAYFWQKIFKDKHKIIQGVFLFIINTIFLLCQFGYGIATEINGKWQIELRHLNNYKHYAKVINSNDEYLKDVFPSAIPADATNIRMSGSVSSPLLIASHKKIALSFTATPEYINKELKRFENIKPYKVKKSELKEYNETDAMFKGRQNPVLRQKLPIDHLDNGDYSGYFVILKYEYPDENHKNTFNGGCLINKDSNKIVYYYDKLYGDYCNGCYKKRVN